MTMTPRADLSSRIQRGHPIFVETIVGPPATHLNEVRFALNDGVMFWRLRWRRCGASRWRAGPWFSRQYEISATAA
jgi:hypothetical protein